MNHKDWFYERKWGLFSHFHSLPQGSARSGYQSYNSINERVNAFDTDRYAQIVHKINAGYVMFTVMQGSKYLCAPNETFNQITGYKTGEACSERDLIADLIKSLDKYDIPLFLYFTGDGPYKDEQAGIAFGYHDREVEVVTEEFVDKWTAVMKEYAVRYGNKIRGWWIDGAFDYFGYLNHDDYLKRYADAAKAGNPHALMAFNNGVIQVDLKNPVYEKFYGDAHTPLQKIRRLEKYAHEGNMEAKAAFRRVPGNSYRYSRYEDYTAGEANEYSELPKGRFVEGSQWHLLSFLGIPMYCNELWGNTGWNSQGSQYSADYMYDYVKKCNKFGGVVSIDAYLYDDGHLDWGQYEILKRLGELRK